VYGIRRRGSFDRPATGPTRQARDGKRRCDRTGHDRSCGASAPIPGGARTIDASVPIVSPAKKMTCPEGSRPSAGASDCNSMAAGIGAMDIPLAWAGPASGPVSDPRRHDRRRPHRQIRRRLLSRRPLRVDPGIPSGQNASAISSSKIQEYAAANLHYCHFPLPLPIPSTERGKRKWEVRQKARKMQHRLPCKRSSGKVPEARS
jgi:hypothetical protein